MSSSEATTDRPADAETGDSSLRENFSQQQAKITALKELVRQTEATQGKRTASAQEKAKTIAQRLTQLKSKSARAKHADKSLGEVHEEHGFPSAAQSSHTLGHHHHQHADDETPGAILATRSSAPFHASTPALHRADSERAETPGSEKIQLLRRQMEQNRARMAEREHSKRDIEQLVTQLKAKFDSSQMSLDRSASISNLGRSIGDLSLDPGAASASHERRHSQRQLSRTLQPSAAASSARDADRFQSSADLTSLGKTAASERRAAATSSAQNFDRERIRYLEQRCARLEQQAGEREQQFAERNASAEQAQRQRDQEARIIDLEEQLREKDSLIEARTQAVGVVSELGRNAEDELQDTRGEWAEAQRRFADAEEELRAELADREVRIAGLEEANGILEQARFELTVQVARMQDGAGGASDQQAQVDWAARLEESQRQNEQLQRRIGVLEVEASAAAAAAAAETLAEEKTPSIELETVVALTARVEELNARVERLQQENAELAAALAAADATSTAQTDETHDPHLPARCADQQAEIARHLATIERLDAELQEKCTECSVLSANCAVLQSKLQSAAPKSLFSAAADETSSTAAATDASDARATSGAGGEAKLKRQLDDANKAAIKTKLKMRQLQKQIDTLRKADETARQLGELSDANETLRQRVAELEALAEATHAPSGSADVLEATCTNQIAAIRLLEEQKTEIADDLSSTRAELSALRAERNDAAELDRTAHVTGAMEAIEQEETLAACRAQIAELQTDIAAGRAERAALTDRLNRYAAENVELLERWDKVNKGSSAESIEIVENLTASERLEMEAIERGIVKADAAAAAAAAAAVAGAASALDASNSSDELLSASTTSTLTSGAVVRSGVAAEDDDGASNTDSSAMSQDLSDSLVRLREESSELMERIEAFTTERREVLEKMELLREENGRLEALVAELRADGERLHGERASSETRCVGLAESLRAAEVERSELRATVGELQTKRLELREDVNAAVAAASGEQRPAAAAVEFSGEPYEKSLRALEALLEGYRRGKDKNAKFDVSKRLAKEAKNTVDLVQRLLVEHVEVVGRVNELHAQLAAAAVPTADASVGPADAQRVERLQSDLSAAQAACARYEAERAAVDGEIAALRTELERQREATAKTTDRLAASVEERDILQQLVTEQKGQLIDTITELQQTCDEHAAEVERLQQRVASSDGDREQYGEELQQRLVALKKLFDENNAQLEQQAAELRHKQETIDALNAQLMDVYRSGEDAAGQLAAKDDELSYLQEIIDAKALEERALNARWEESEATVQRLEASVAQQLQAIRALEDKTKQATAELADAAEVQRLRAEIAELETRNKEQLDKLKKFAANLKKKNQQCGELTEQLAQLERQAAQAEVLVTDDAIEWREKYAAIERQLQQKNDQTAEMQTELERLAAASIDSNRLSDLSDSLDAEREKVTALTAQLGELAAEKHKLSDAHAKLEREHAALVTESEQQATNLAQSTGDLQQLRQQHAAVEAQLRQQATATEATRTELATERSALNELRIKIEKCKTIIREKNRELKRLQDLVAELQSSAAVVAAPETAGTADERAQLQAALAAERLRLEAQTLKLTEHEHFIETLQAENTQLNGRITQLEEHIGTADERAAEIARSAGADASALHELRHSAEAAAQQHASEAQSLHVRLATAGQQLADLAAARDELQAALRDAHDDGASAAQRVHEATVRQADLEQQLHAARDESARLADDLARVSDELKRTRAEASAQLAAKHSEIDALENDLSAQLQRLEADRRRLQEEADRERDAGAELAAEAERLKEIVASLEQTSGELERDCGWLRMQNEGMQQDQVEVQELRMQIVHDQTEMENMQAQAQLVVQQHEVEVTALRQQLAELDSLRTQIGQNQTDDQMCIQNENERLQARLAAMEAEVQQYQRQNLQLQMAAATATTAATPGAGAGAAGGLFDVETAATSAAAAAAAATVACSDSEKRLLNEQMQAVRAQLDGAVQQLRVLQAQLDDQTAALAEERAQRAVDVEKLRMLTVEMAAVQEKIDEQQAENEALRERIATGGADANADEQLRGLSAELAAAREADAAKERRIQELQAAVAEQTWQLHAGAVAQEQVIMPTKAAAAVAGVPNPRPTDAASDDSAEALRRNVSHLEDYINDLQIQLRIATNDCEQMAHTQQSLEEEIQQRSRRHEHSIAELQARLQSQQQQQQSVVDSSIVLSSIESQIIPPSNQIDSAAVRAFDGAMFFGQTTANTAAAESTFERLLSPSAGAASVPPPQQLEPVVEPPIVPKAQYLCHDGSDADDGWGFGAEEAVLEEQHQQQQQQHLLQSAVAPAAPANAQLQAELELQIAELTAAQDRLRADNAALQLKSAKMLKKLKEYKTRNDELLQHQQQQAAVFTKAGSVESTQSDDLDRAIQDELNAQVQQLEKRLRETRTDQEKELAERQALLKRVDVLTAANERFAEMKERQDAEMEVCRMRQRQLQQQLDQMQEWQEDDAGSSSAVAAAAAAVPVAEQQPQTAAAPIADAAESEKLQLELDELHTECAELRQHNAGLVKELRTQKAHAEALDTAAANESVALREQVRTLQARLGESVATIDGLSADSTAIRQHLDQLRADHEQKCAENRQLSEQFATMNEQLGGMKAALLDTRQADSTAAAGGELNAERQRCAELTELVQLREAECAHLSGQVQEMQSGFEAELEAKSGEILRLHAAVDGLKRQQEELQRELASANPQNAAADAASGADSTVELQTLRDANARLSAALADLQAEKLQMEHELSVLNDQVIGSLNLEDDLRAQSLQMDAKTIEIAELKGSVARLTAQLQQLQQQQQHQQPEPQPPVGAVVDLESQAAQLNAHWAHVLEQRCAEVAENWRQHLSAREDEFAAQLARQPVCDAMQQTHGASASTASASPTATTTNTSDTTASTPSASSTAVSSAANSPQKQRPILRSGDDADDDDDGERDRNRAEEGDSSSGNIGALQQQVEQMQQALETQEMEIVTLKEQLAIRSAEYARLAAQVDPFGVGKNVKQQQQQQQRPEPNQKSELDLALYMLHQRDMRCEELTEELMSLLQERDTLQLKLAGSMRHIEHLRSVAKETGVEVPDVVEPVADKLPTPVDPSLPPPRHKTLRDEREQRQRQMAILQRDVSTLPAEAFAELMGADYRPSATQTIAGQPEADAAGGGGVAAAEESPYTALLNLFWGPRAAQS